MDNDKRVINLHSIGPEKRHDDQGEKLHIILIIMINVISTVSVLIFLHLIAIMALSINLMDNYIFLGMNSATKASYIVAFYGYMLLFVYISLMYFLLPGLRLCYPTAHPPFLH